MAVSASGFRDRLHGGPPLLLDGPMGTQLEARGVPCSLPLWSAWGLLEEPEVVRLVHEDYVRAGAEILTTNTFRTHRRSLTKADVGHRAGELTALAVRLAREASAGRAWVAGSVAPLEDCFQPDLTPDPAALSEEHEEMVASLVDAGVDVLLVETMPTVREAAAAAQAATATGRPVLVGLTCGTDGRLRSGETVAEAASVLEPLGPEVLLINCTPTHALGGPLRELADATSLPIGAYGNVGHAEGPTGWTSTEPMSPAQYVAHVHGWLDTGARLVGGCCGTGPEHIAAVREALQRRSKRC